MENLSSTLTASNPMPGEQTFPPGLFEAQSLLCNHDPRNLIAPLREAKSALACEQALSPQKVRELQIALLLQDEWEASLVQREFLKNDVQRGRECLKQVRRELESLRAQLNDWAAYERICGHNPLPDFVQALIVKERIEQFLPVWIKQQEEQIAALTRKMEPCAQHHGLRHLL
jgi:hypothetical protein